MYLSANSPLKSSVWAAATACGRGCCGGGEGTRSDGMDMMEGGGGGGTGFEGMKKDCDDEVGGTEY